MRKTILAMTLAAMASFALGMPSAITYHGKVTRNDGSSISDPTEVPIAFAVYDAAGDSLPAWTMAIPVLLNDLGEFQVVLEDGLASATYGEGQAALAELIASGRANYIGVKFGDDNEQYPRRQIISAPRVAYAGRAKEVGAGGHVNEASAGTVDAAALNVRAGAIKGLAFTSPADMSVASLSASSAGNLTVSADSSLVYGSHSRTSKFANPPAGTVLFEAGANDNGVVTIIADGSWSAPCLMFPVAPGDILNAPINYDVQVRVVFTPFGTDN